MGKNHKQNSNFQITYFLAGKCHTPDGAYAMLCDLQENREASISHYEVSKLKEKAKIIRANRLVNSKDEADILDGQAELLEIENNSKSGKILYEAAQDELNHINKCIAAVQPLRRYAEYPDIEAHELAQQEEWGLELIHRAENYILTNNSVPADHFVTMRMHPDFKKVIAPKIDEILKITSTRCSVLDAIKKLESGKKNFELPLLIE